MIAVLRASGQLFRPHDHPTNCVCRKDSMNIAGFDSVLHLKPCQRRADAHRGLLASHGRMRQADAGRYHCTIVYHLAHVRHLTRYLKLKTQSLRESLRELFKFSVDTYEGPNDAVPHTDFTEREMPATQITPPWRKQDTMGRYASGGRRTSRVMGPAVEHVERNRPRPLALRMHICREPRTNPHQCSTVMPNRTREFQGNHLISP